MQINLENLSGLERKLNITVPAEQIEDKVKAKLKKIALEAKIPGFRPGKVPFDMVKSRYEGGARAEVLEDLVRETYTDAIKKSNINPASFPNIKITSSKPGEQLVYEAVFEVYPEIKINDFKQIEVEKETAEVTDEDINVMLERMRSNRAKWEEITDSERKSQLGDQLTIDFTVKPCVPGKDAEVTTEKDVKFVLGDGSMWVDFEQPLYGVSPGEEKSYNLQFPAEHADKTLAGNKVDFVVKINKVCQPILLDLDDEFATSMNIKGGLEGLKTEMREHMERDMQDLLRGVFKDTVMTKILDSNPIEVPKALVEEELRALAAEWQHQFTSSKKVSVDKAPPFPRDKYEAQAKRTVALRLLLSEVIAENKIMVGPQEVRKKIEDTVSAYYEDSADKKKMLEKYFADRQRVAETEAFLLEEKVLGYLESQIKIVEKTIGYKEAMAKRK